MRMRHKQLLCWGILGNFPIVRNVTQAQADQKASPSAGFFCGYDFTLPLQGVVLGRSHRPFYSVLDMTEVSRIADSTMFKLVVPILQTITSLGALAAFGFVVSSLSSIQATLNAQQTAQAVTVQRIGSIERTMDAYGLTISVVKSSTEKQAYQIETLTDAVKQMTINGRPK